MRKLVFYWLRLYRNNQSLLRRRFPDFKNKPARKKKVSLSSPSLHHKFKERLAGKPVFQGDESGAGVRFGFV